MSEQPVTGHPLPRLLLVDDEAHIVAALQRELRQQPLQLVPFTDPLAALQAFYAEGAAVVLSDNLMPGLTGLELLSRIHERTPETRRVLLTGRTALGDAIAAFNAGHIHRFINKPWSKTELVTILDEELARYHDTTEARRSHQRMAHTVQQRTAMLRQTVTALKQAETRLALHEDQSQLARSPVPVRLRRLSYLVVDADSGVREEVATTLRKAGVSRCLTVGSAEEALDCLQHSPALDVIIADWNLSDHDALTLFEAVRSGNTLSAQAQFIVMSTRENRKAVEFALQRGIQGYVIKPFHLSTLLGQVDEALGRSGRVSLEERLEPLRPLTFLVANADLDGRFALQNALAGAGLLNVLMADSGPKVTRILEEKDVDLVLYDFNVRDPGWQELNDAVAALPRPVAPPALVVTSVTPMAEELEAINRHHMAESFVPAPFERKALLRAILRAWSDRWA